MRIHRVKHRHSNTVHAIKRREFGTFTVYRTQCGRAVLLRDGWKEIKDHKVTCKTCLRSLR